MSCNPGLNRGRYFRLMTLSCLDIIGTIPLNLYYIVKNATLGVRPWISWDNIHRDYSHVILVPSSFWKYHHDMAQAVELHRWALVMWAFLFFAFFGFAEEARRNYRRAFTSLISRIGLSTSSGTLNNSSQPYVAQCTYRDPGAHLFSARRLSLI
jgi:pheromone a factor receptor